MPLEPGQVKFDTAGLEGLTVRAAQRGLNAAGQVVVARVRQNLNRPGRPVDESGETNRVLKLGEKFDQHMRGYGGTFSYGGSGATLKQQVRALRMLERARDRYLKFKAKTADRFGKVFASRAYLYVDPPGGMPRRRWGRLFRSIRSRRGEMPLSVEIGSEGVIYAATHEYGSRTVPARPYLRPSLRQVEGDGSLMAAFVRNAKAEFEAGGAVKP